jgi:hypothetical protein
MRKLILISTIAAAMGSPMIASAESAVTSAASGSISTAARLDFKIVIPRVLFLAVGTGAGGTALTGNATIDLVSFDYTSNASAVGTGAAAGAVSGTAVPVRVVGNAGPIGLTAATSGALNNGLAAETIPWSEITAVSSDATNFPSPVIPATGTGASSAVVVSSGTKITNRTATWTYSYANTTIVPAGTYGGAGTAVAGLNNGRVTYTATMP